MAWRFSHKSCTDQSSQRKKEKREKSYDFKAEMRNSLLLCEGVLRGSHDDPSIDVDFGHFCKCVFSD